MTKYVPTTGEVRFSYLDRKDFIRQTFGFGADEAEATVEFDAWLASVKAEAWEEGVHAQAAAYGMDPDTGPNPYRGVSNDYTN